MTPAKAPRVPAALYLCRCGCRRGYPADTYGTEADRAKCVKYVPAPAARKAKRKRRGR